MPFWGWIVIGVLLLGAELTLIDAAFYLVFIGISAIIVGLMGLAGVIMPIWGQWLLFAGLSIATMFLFRGQLYKKLRGGLPGFEDKSMGSTVLLKKSFRTWRKNPCRTSWFNLDSNQCGSHRYRRRHRSRNQRGRWPYHKT